MLGAAISRTENERLIVDVGLKAISSERGMLILKNPAGARLRKLNAEHAVVDITDPRLTVDVGDRIGIWSHYSDGTVNSHRRMYGVRDGQVEEIL